MSIEFGPITSFDQDDLDLLDESFRLEPGFDMQFFQEKILLGDAVIWRLLDDDAEALFVLLGKVVGGEKVLHMWHLAGRGAFHKHGQFTVDALAEYGRKQGFKKLTSQSIPVIANLLEKYGFTKTFVSMEKEL